VDIDQATYAKYQTIPAGPLRILIDANIVRLQEGPDGKKPPGFARINMPPSMQCPFHNAERLCQIQVEHGETYLSQTCASYPRTTRVIDKLSEMTLTLSCPEACRLVLMNPDLLPTSMEGVHHLDWNDWKSNLPLIRYFWPIREFTIGLIRNRAYPLWQRMFLLGTFSRRLEAVVRGEIKGGFSAMLKGFSGAVASASLNTSIETIPADLALQLGMVLSMMKLRASNALLSPRLVECLNTFAQGIGYGRLTNLQELSAEYAIAYERYYAPFFLRHPYILENYLINMVFHKMFPFGAQLNDQAAAPQPAKEFALLAADFALIKGLLIGVAGGHKEAFSAEHVVQTVQTAFKYFEHNSDFLVNAHQILVTKKLDNAHGLTMLLRN
jgi:lysine-N-methylase